MTLEAFVESMFDKALRAERRAAAFNALSNTSPFTLINHYLRVAAECDELIKAHMRGRARKIALEYGVTCS